MKTTEVASTDPQCTRKLRRTPWRIPAKDKPKPSLETDGRTVLSWDAPGIVWKPFETLIVSAWGRP
jgi:hypothetical protein